MNTPHTYRDFMTLRNAFPGLLLTGTGILVFKTKYGTAHMGVGGEQPVIPELYAAATGERYLGDVEEACVDVTSECEVEAKTRWRIP